MLLSSAYLTYIFFLFLQSKRGKSLSANGIAEAFSLVSAADVFIIQINVGHQSWQPVGGTGKFKSAITSPNSLISQRLNEKGSSSGSSTIKKIIILSTTQSSNGVQFINISIVMTSGRCGAIIFSVN